MDWEITTLLGRNMVSPGLLIGHILIQHLPLKNLRFVKKELWICFRYFSIQQEQRIPNQILKNSFRITMNRFTCTKSLIAISKSLVRMWTRLQYYLCNFYWLQDTPRQSLLRITGITAPLIYDSGI